MSSAPHALLEFVEGRLETDAFEKLLYQDTELEALLSQQQAPPYAHTGHTLYHFLIALNYRSPGEVLTAQTAIADHLEGLGVPVIRSKRPRELFDLIQSALPKWLNADEPTVHSLLQAAPTFAKQSQLKQWLRFRLLEKYRYLKKPPLWLQSPCWPIGKNGPLVFLGQIAVDGYLHDTAVAYVFHDPASNECTTILQAS